MIDIILVTYNGEKYLRQQLLSLMSQTYSNWHCILHDDGSTDKTVEIIKEFINLDNRFELISDNIELHNSGSNFLHTLKYSTAEYVCFCDQDDIWLESKLEKLFNLIEIKDNSIPQVIFCNAYLWNSKTNLINNKATLTYPRTLKDLLFLNCGIQGCSAIFNKKMTDILKIKLNTMCMHDYYLTLAGTVLGEIDYLDDCLMLYRQHGNNVTGYADGTIKNKYKKILTRSKIPLVNKKHLESLKCFYEKWKTNINESDSLLIEKFIQSEKTNYFSRFFMIINNKFNIYGSTLKLLIKFILRPYIGE